MPPAALLLVLLAAICHSTWNLLVKADARRLEIQSGALIVGTAICAPVLLFFSPSELTGRAWAMVVLSALFETGYVLALSAAYGAGELSLVYPIARGSAPVLVAPIAVWLLGERVSLQGLTGIGLIVVGILTSHGAGGLAAARTHGRAVAWALLTGVFIAGYSLVNKVGVGLAPVVLYAFLVFGINAVAVHIVAWLRTGSLPTLRPNAPWRRIALVGSLMISAYLAVLTAMSLARVSYVVAAREVSVVIAALMGAVALREPHSPWRIAGALTIFAGLSALALAR